MAGYTSAMLGAFKASCALALHCFAATVTPTGTLTNTATTIGSLSSAVGLVHGMPVSGTGIPANTFILNNAGTWLLSQAATASNSGVTLTCIGDVFKIALGKVSPTGTYDASSTNYTDLTGNSDEVSGTGYTAGGATLSANISPANTAGTAFWSWTTNPSWSSASFSARAALIYNSSRRGPTATIAVSVHDFGGTQTVTSGTFTLLLPTNDSSNAILRIT